MGNDWGNILDTPNATTQTKKTPPAKNARRKVYREYHMIKTDPQKIQSQPNKKHRMTKEQKPTQVKCRSILRYWRTISFQGPPSLIKNIYILLIGSWELEKPENHGPRGDLLNDGDAGKKEIPTIQTMPHYMERKLKKRPVKRQENATWGNNQSGRTMVNIARKRRGWRWIHADSAWWAGKYHAIARLRNFPRTYWKRRDG